MCSSSHFYLITFLSNFPVCQIKHGCVDLLSHIETVNVSENSGEAINSGLKLSLLSTAEISTVIGFDLSMIDMLCLCD